MSNEYICEEEVTCDYTGTERQVRMHAMGEHDTDYGEARVSKTGRQTDVSDWRERYESEDNEEEPSSWSKEPGLRDPESRRREETSSRGGVIGFIRGLFN